MFLSCSVGEAPHHAREVLSRKAKPSVKKKIFLAVVSIAYLAHIPRPLCVPITERTNKHRSRISEARERCGAVLNVSFLGQIKNTKLLLCQNGTFFLWTKSAGIARPLGRAVLAFLLLCAKIEHFFVF